MASKVDKVYGRGGDYEPDGSVHGLWLLCIPLFHVGDNVASSGTSSRRVASRPTQFRHFELCGSEVEVVVTIHVT